MVDLVEIFLTAGIEAGAVFLAIYLEFKREKEERQKEFWKRVREISPFLYFEMLENKWLIDQFQKDKYRFAYDQKRFNTTSWEIFKEHLSTWREWNVIPISRLFTKLIHANRILDMIDIKTLEITTTQDRRLSIIGISLNNADRLITSTEIQFEKWFNEKPSANIEKVKVLNELRKNAEEDTVLNDFLIWYDRVYQDDSIPG